MNHFKLIVLLFVLSIMGNNSFSQITLSDSLIVFYRFNGNSQDASGNGNDGIPYGPVSGPDRFGRPDSAYYFDGVNDYLDVLNNQKLHAQLPITTTAWVNINSTTLANNIFANCFVNYQFNGITFIIDGNGHVTFNIGDGGGANPNGRRTKSGTTTLQLGSWYHVATVCRGPQDMDIYVNGKRDCGTYSGSGGSLSYAAGQMGRVGKGSSVDQPFFDGAIDDLRFYNRELSKSEIRELAGLPELDTMIFVGDSVQLNAGFGTVISWTPSTNLSCTNCANPYAFPSSETTYMAITENSAGCRDTVYATIFVEGAVGLEEEITNEPFELSYNSNTYSIQVLSQESGLGKIRIFDALGKTLAISEMNNFPGEMTWKLPAQVAEGIYLVQFEQNEKIVTTRIFISE